ncbi:MAG TPA: hypothetical protein DEA49_01725 [Petrotoga sp.]|nr:MAG: GCN5-related N-acetyltransferase [Petrotoga mobilis]HBT50823.1 hypothetical protein [Petrotoga sp.]
MGITTTSEEFGFLSIKVLKKRLYTILGFFLSIKKKGFAKGALKKLEETLKKEKVKFIELNVFGNNKVAYNLYKNLGFGETHINLMKGFQKQRVITLPKYLKFLESFFLKSGYRIVAIEMRKKL